MFARWFREENAFKGVRLFPYYTRGIWKRRLYSENTLNVFPPRYKKGIVWTDNKHRRFWTENSVREMTPSFSMIFPLSKWLDTCLLHNDTSNEAGSTLASYVLFFSVFCSIFWSYHVSLCNTHNVSNLILLTILSQYFRLYKNEKPAFSNSSGLNVWWWISVDGRPNHRNKTELKISPMLFGRCLCTKHRS